MSAAGNLQRKAQEGAIFYPVLISHPADFARALQYTRRLLCLIGHCT
jgi:hypothetical protein